MPRLFLKTISVVVHLPRQKSSPGSIWCEKKQPVSAIITVPLNVVNAPVPGATPNDVQFSFAERKRGSSSTTVTAPADIVRTVQRGCAVDGDSKCHRCDRNCVIIERNKVHTCCQKLSCQLCGSVVSSFLRA